VREDVLRWARSWPCPFDVALCDPPYAFDKWDELLNCLDADLAVLESDRAVDVGEGWEVLREKRYGSTVVLVVRKTKGGR
jgi:16S rRNA (guanine966-N2)-methyltransferase